MLPMADKEFFETISVLIKAKLEKAYQMGDLVDITGIYGIGTSFTLTAFAKEKGFGVIVASNDSASHLRSSFNYPHVYSVYDTPDPNVVKNVVIDAGITKVFVEQQNLTVQTGYHRKESRRI
ncbi:MAG: hypothetical protein ACM3UZ_03185 [Acidobacteriota bacterium]